MGNSSRDKGGRVERLIVRFLQECGFAARKVSGMYKPGEDFTVTARGRALRGEVKARADGFRELYSWLEDRDVLIVKADRKEPLAITRLSLAATLVGT
jgi:Holliday junction resolvase